MARYLLVAHQTATDAGLLSRVSELVVDDPEASFTLLVPATRVNHLLVYEPGESETIAWKRADEARRLLGARDVRVTRAIVGDESPLLSIEDELRAHPNAHDAVVLSTLPPGRSRWLAMGVYRQAKRRLDVPVLHIYQGGDEAWEEAKQTARRLLADSSRARQQATERAMRRERVGMRAFLPVGLLMFLYLTVTTTLALQVDRGFLLNDALALGVFLVLGGGMLVAERWTLVPDRPQRGRGRRPLQAEEEECEPLR